MWTVPERSGEVEGWRGGEAEGWKDGEVEEWRDGMEGWSGGMEGWRDGKVEMEGWRGWRDRGEKGWIIENRCIQCMQSGRLTFHG